MSGSRRTPRISFRPTPVYEVGYGRTPRSRRWKPGQSGNPKGRRKGTKTVDKIIDDALMRKVTVEEDGRPVTLTLQEVIIRNLVNAAARRDLKAIVTLFRLRDHYQDSSETTLKPADLDPNDQAIIEAYLEKIQGTSSTFGTQPATETSSKNETGLGREAKPNQESSDGESS